jgi:hypothetical protein
LAIVPSKVVSNTAPDRFSSVDPFTAIVSPVQVVVPPRESLPPFLIDFPLPAPIVPPASESVAVSTSPPVHVDPVLVRVRELVPSITPPVNSRVRSCRGALIVTLPFEILA